MLELKMIVITMLGMVLLGDSGNHVMYSNNSKFDHDNVPHHNHDYGHSRRIMIMFLIIIMMMGTVGAGDLGNEFQ